jgi:hypothetical protein
MANYVTTPLNPSVSLVENEELEETPLDMNVSQRSREKITVRKSGAHSSRSFGMGSSIVP